MTLELRPWGALALCLLMAAGFLIVGFGPARFLAALGVPLAAALAGQDTSPPGLHPIALGAIVPLGFAVFLVRQRRLVFDRGTGEILLQSRGLLGARETRHTLAEFTGASVETKVEERSEEEGWKQRAAVSRAQLNFGRSAAPVPLMPFFTRGPGPERQAAAINAWFAQ